MKATHVNPAEPIKKTTVLFETKAKEYTLRAFKGPLVVHAFSDKVQQQIAAKQAKAAKGAKEARDPAAECADARYLNAAGQECLPITAVKKSLIRAADQFDDLPKTHLRQALFVSVIGDESAPVVPITDVHGKNLVGKMRQDGVTIGISTKGLAYRPEYLDWQIAVKIEYNPRLVSEVQLDALVDAAGFGVGICEGRPEKNSALGWGRFARVGGPFISQT